MTSNIDPKTGYVIDVLEYLNRFDAATGECGRRCSDCPDLDDCDKFSVETLQNEIAESKAETARINAEIEARELRHTELLEREVRNVTQQFPPFGLPTEYISDLPTEASDETPASHEFANFTPDQVARPAAQRDPGIPSAAKRATFAPF